MACVLTSTLLYTEFLFSNDAILKKIKAFFKNVNPVKFIYDKTSFFSHDTFPFTLPNNFVNVMGYTCGPSLQDTIVYFYLNANETHFICGGKYCQVLTT